MSNSTSTNADLSAVILGGEEDPKAMLRSEAPNTLTWPDGALFAIEFHCGPRDAKGRRLSHWRECFGDVETRIEFFGADGWPLAFPEERKAKLSVVVKKEFQIDGVRDWRRWDEGDWMLAEKFGDSFPRFRAMRRFTAPLAAQTSRLA